MSASRIGSVASLQSLFVCLISQLAAQLATPLLAYFLAGHAWMPHLIVLCCLHNCLPCLHAVSCKNVCVWVAMQRFICLACFLTSVGICSKVVSITTDSSTYIAAVETASSSLSLKKERKRRKRKGTKRHRGVADWGAGAYPGSRGCACPPQEGGGQAGSPGQLPSPAAACLRQSESHPLPSLYIPILAQSCSKASELLCSY